MAAPQLTRLVPCDAVKDLARVASRDALAVSHLRRRCHAYSLRCAATALVIARLFLLDRVRLAQGDRQAAGATITSEAHARS